MTLTAKKIESLLKVGKKCRTLDEKGLYLQLKSSTNASWILRYVSPTKHKTCELGLGPVSRISLAEARQKAAEARLQVSEGVDPITAKLTSIETRVAAVSSFVTFGQAAEQFFEAQQSRWRNKKVREGWLPHMRRHAARIWDVPVNQVDQQLTLMVVQPLWGPKHVTARQVMHRVGQVLDFSRVMGWRAGANPARFKGELEYVLPKRPANVNVRHHPSVPLSDLPALMERLATAPGTGALAARFCILTASRPGEVFGATWAEINRDLWRIPAHRYKTGKEHIVPLSTAALRVLAEAPRLEGNPHIFVSPLKAGAPLCNMACIALFKRLGIGATVHGTARSTFRRTTLQRCRTRSSRNVWAIRWAMPSTGLIAEAQPLINDGHCWRLGPKLSPLRGSTL